MDVVLRGCIRAERIEDPSYYIHEILKRAKPEHLKKNLLNRIMGR